MTRPSELRLTTVYSQGNVRTTTIKPNSPFQKLDHWQRHSGSLPLPVFAALFTA